jgi:hypothetical protein
VSGPSLRRGTGGSSPWPRRPPGSRLCPGPIGPPSRCREESVVTDERKGRLDKGWRARESWWERWWEEEVGDGERLEDDYKDVQERFWEEVLLDKLD